MTEYGHEWTLKSFSPQRRRGAEKKLILLICF